MLVLAEQRIEQLTPREREVLEHLVNGCSSKVVARELSISPRTVEVHRARIMNKMEAHRLARLVRMAVDIDEWPKQNHREAVQAVRRAERLTPREREVLDHIVAGSSNKEIARDLNISPRTVEAHRAHIIEKMEAENLSHLVLMACAIEA